MISLFFLICLCYQLLNTLFLEMKIFKITDLYSETIIATTNKRTTDQSFISHDHTSFIKHYILDFAQLPAKGRFINGIHNV